MISPEQSVPTEQWKTLHFTPHDRTLALEEASHRAYASIHSMLRVPAPAAQGRHELESLWNELHHIDEELESAALLIEILYRMLDQAEHKRAYLDSLRRDKYDQCQAAAIKRSEHRQIRLPPEIISHICSFAVYSSIYYNDISQDMETWGNVLWHSTTVSVDDKCLVKALSDPALSKFRKKLFLDAAPQGKSLKLVQDAYQRGKIESVEYFADFSHQAVPQFFQQQKDFLRVCDSLDIKICEERYEPGVPLIWTEDLTPKLRTISSQIYYLPKFGNLLRNVTVLEVALPEEDPTTIALEDFFLGLDMPNLKTLALIGGGPSWKGGYQNGAIKFPTLPNLEINSCNAVLALSLLKKIKSESLKSLELQIDTSRHCRSIPDLLDYVCTSGSMDSLTRLTIHFDFGSKLQERPQITTVEELIDRLLPRKGRVASLPRLASLVIPYWSSISMSLVNMLASRASLSQPIQTLAFNNRARSDDPNYGRMSLYVTNVIVEDPYDPPMDRYANGHPEESDYDSLINNGLLFTDEMDPDDDFLD